MVELDANLQPVVPAPTGPVVQVNPPQTDTSSRLRHLLDTPSPNEIPAEAVEVKTVETSAAQPPRQRPPVLRTVFSPASLTLVGSLLFLIMALGFGVVVYNGTSPQVTPVVNISLPTRNPTKEAQQNKPIPSDQTQAAVFLPTNTVETTVASTPPQTTVNIEQPAQTEPPTQEPVVTTVAPPTAPQVLGPAFGTQKPDDLSGVASAPVSSDNSFGGNKLGGSGSGSSTTQTPGDNAATPEGSGGGQNSAVPTLPARTFAPAPPFLQVNGQSGRVYQVAFAADGKYVATANNDNSVRLWDAVTGKQIRVLWGHAGPVYSLAFSPDGQMLASAGADRSILLWNLSTGKLIRKMTGHTSEINSVAFSPGGQILATGSTDLSIRLWDVNTGAQVSIAKGHSGPVQSVAFSPDGKALASGADDQLIMLWDLSTYSNPLQRAVLKGHTSRIFLVAFSPDGKLLASASLATSNNLKVWDLDSGKELVNLAGHDQPVFSLAFSPEGKLLASGGDDRTVRLWDPRQGTLLGTFTGATGTVTSVAFSPDGKTLVGAGEDQIVRLWKIDAS